MPNGYQQVLGKKSNEMEKPLDNRHQVWYNNNVRGRADRPLKEREGRDRSPKPTSASGDFPERKIKKVFKTP